ncbi:MAG: N-6 DNA methylase [Myxococcales bacterium]|nr:N-6 DNA methylase [Myxococcales bacterium]
MTPGAAADAGAVLDAWLTRLAAQARQLRARLQEADGGAGLCLPMAALGLEVGIAGDRLAHERWALDEGIQLLVTTMAFERACRDDGAGRAAERTLAGMPWSGASDLLPALLAELEQALDSRAAQAALEEFRAFLEGPVPAGLLPSAWRQGLASRYDRFVGDYAGRGRRRAGVYYTPPELADFMVGRVDAVLRQELGVERGLCDPVLRILDPAAGSGAFLYSVVAHCRRRWPGADLPTLLGFERCASAYALCCLQLSFAGVPIDGLRLGNALFEPPRAASGLPLTSGRLLRALENERQASAALRADSGIDVIVANPPYRRSSENRHPELEQRLVRYRRGLEAERNQQPLADDYVKFVRTAECWLEGRPRAVLALITPATFLTGRLFAGMRESLRRSFPRVDVIDLHGGARAPREQGSVDENVFGIGSAVALTLWCRGAPAAASYTELRGTRGAKLAALRDGVVPQARPLGADGPRAPLHPGDGCPAEYRDFVSLEQLFDFRSVAAKPGDDRRLVCFRDDEVIAAMERAREQAATLAAAEGHGGGSEAMRKLARRPQEQPFDATRIRPYCYRPFDTRFVYDDAAIWTRPVRALRPHVDGQPLLLTTRVVKDATFAHVFATRLLPDVIALSPASSVNAHVFPMARLREPALAAFGARTSGERVFRYLYALLHSPDYRRRYLGGLRQDFPRVPQGCPEPLFDGLAELGGRLLGLHLGEAAAPRLPGLGFVDGGDRRVLRVGERGRALSMLEPGPGRLHINDSSHFEAVPQAAWKLRIGGHQPAHRWLNERKRAGRSLTDDDLETYCGVVAALFETQRLMAEIDAQIDAHGGWPAAFDVRSR